MYFGGQFSDVELVKVFPFFYLAVASSLRVLVSRYLAGITLDQSLIFRTLSNSGNLSKVPSEHLM